LETLAESRAEGDIALFERIPPEWNREGMHKALWM
jgi:hypothetical protein